MAASGNLMPRRRKVVVTITGAHSPGALSDTMHVLGTSGPNELVDFGQLVVRNRFTATAVLALAPGESSDVFKDIIFRAHATGFQVDFDASQQVSSAVAKESHANTSISPVSRLSSTEPVSSREEYMVTLFSLGSLPTAFFASTTRAISEHGANISSINRLTDETDRYMCFEMVITLNREDDAFEQLRGDLFKLGRIHEGADVAIQPARVRRIAKRIVVFDLSWTLVRGDALDILLHAAAVAPSVEARAAHDKGAMDGPKWTRARVKSLAGKNADEVNQAAFKTLAFTDGAKELCKGLKKLGCRLAVVSSGSKKIAEYAKSELGLDYAYGNVFETNGMNEFTGCVSEPIVDADRKADLVYMLAMQEGVDTQQVIAVGDGPVSSKMLAAAGMSIAFDQPDSVDAIQTGRISSKSLASVFFLLGVTGRDFRELIKA